MLWGFYYGLIDASFTYSFREKVPSEHHMTMELHGLVTTESGFKVLRSLSALDLDDEAKRKLWSSQLLISPPPLLHWLELGVPIHV